MTSYVFWKMCVVVFGSNSLKVSVLFSLSSEKKCLLLFGSKSVKVSALKNVFAIVLVLFDMKSKKL